MHTWNLATGDPLSLTLAADARLSATSTTDDQIWELTNGGGEPPALALQTTYGLRAHWMRLLPRFVREITGPVKPAAAAEGQAAGASETGPAAKERLMEAGATGAAGANSASNNAPNAGASVSSPVRLDPAGFHSPPRVAHFYPNFLSVSFAPFEGLEVVIEYWACESQVIAGRIRLTNQSILPQSFRMEWVALLNPIDRQGGMVAQQVGPSYVLAGETAYLSPVVVLTGGPQPVSSPYPALAHSIELYPGNTRQFSWAIAAMRSYETSLEAARRATARPWEAEIARTELLNLSQNLQIETGNPDWDAALAMTQKTAGELLQKNPSYLPHTSFVLTRRPDQGFSVRGDGSDQSHLWSGQTALDSYFLSSLLLPGAPELATGLLRNFLSVQDETGRIDWKPGLSGQRSHRLAQPLLAALAVKLAPYMPQPQWYQEVYPPLLRFFNSWFSEQTDADGDGFPEWQHPLQSGIEDSPIFDRWSPNAQGIDITRIESPALAAMLLNECGALIEMAGVLEEAEKASTAYARLTSSLQESGAQPAAGGEAVQNPAAQPAGRQAELEQLRAREAALREALESTWDEKARIYRYRDFATHLSQPGQTLMQFSGSGRGSSRKRFQQPNRIIVHLKVKEERTYAVTVTLHGFTAEGETHETIEPRQFSWLGSQARATSQNTFLAVKRVEATGLGDDDEVIVSTANYTQEDCSLLLPLWAGAPDEARARRMVEDVLKARYLGSHGIPVCPPDAQAQEELPGLHTALSSALMTWNHMIGEALLRYGYRELAGELVTRLMEAVTASLKNHSAFRQYYHTRTGVAAGERGHLHGLAPLGLFLNTLGIRYIGQKEIILDGFNPFSSPIIVQYRKIKIICHPDKTEIVFQGGQKVTVDRPGSHRVILK